MWENARKRVADTLDLIRCGFDEIAASRAKFDVDELIDCVGWAVKGLELFSAGTIAPRSVAALGIEFARSVTTSTQFETEFDSYREGIALLRTMLDTLNEQITAEEQTLDDNMRTNLRGISQHKSSFDLSQFPLPPESDTIIIDRNLVDGIARNHMPYIADELDDIARLTVACTPDGAISRSSRLGLGLTGPSDQINELSQFLCNLLKDLAWEVRNGARNLELAAADILGDDEALAQELRQMAALVAEGSPYGPWYENPVPEMRYGRGPRAV